MKLFHINKMFQKEDRQMELSDENLPIKPRPEYFFNQVVIWTIIGIAVVFIILIKKFV